MRDENNILYFSGCHGTEESLAEQILETNFQRSEGEHHWLGEGVYFFTEGIGQPIEHARNWVKSESHKNGYRRFAILTAETFTNDDTLLDLREVSGVELFLQYKRSVLAQLRQIRKNFRVKDTDYADGKVFDHIKEKLGVEIILSHMNVRFGQERIDRINSRIPNCTFLCVSFPEENIEASSIQIIERGNI